MELLKMAPCGIDCNGCNLYRSAFDDARAQALVPWFRDAGWIPADGGYAEVMAKAPFCAGCLGDRSVQWSDECPIRTCCIDQKGLEHCGQCEEFVCRYLMDFAAQARHHADAIEHLKSIRGIE